MADFCKQCASKLFGVDAKFNDFANMQTIEETVKGLYSVVLCEGCGPIQVDHTGKCISIDCLENHNDKEPVKVSCSTCKHAGDGVCDHPEHGHEVGEIGGSWCCNEWWVEYEPCCNQHREEEEDYDQAYIDGYIDPMDIDNDLGCK